MKIDLNEITKALVMGAKKHAPEILTGIGIAGMISAAVLTAKATPRAIELMKEKKNETDKQTLTAGETVCTVWKCYIPAVVTIAASAACIIGGNSINLRRNAALAAAYTLSETAFRDYREQAAETLGETKEKEIRHDAVQRAVNRQPVSDVCITGKGHDLCYDPSHGQRFESDIESIRRSVNYLNQQLLRDPFGCITLNEFYNELGLSETTLGNNFGWTVEKGIIEVDFSSCISEDGRPCLVLNYNIVQL